MTAQARGGALTAGLILIAIGVIFLIESFHENFSVWHLFVRYWPIILIIVGLKRLYAFFAWPGIRPASEQPPHKE